MALIPRYAPSKAQPESSHCLEPSTLGSPHPHPRGLLFPSWIVLQVAMVTAFTRPPWDLEPPGSAWTFLVRNIWATAITDYGHLLRVHPGQVSQCCSSKASVGRVHLVPCGSHIMGDTQLSTNSQPYEPRMFASLGSWSSRRARFPEQNSSWEEVAQERGHTGQV